MCYVLYAVCQYMLSACVDKKTEVNCVVTVIVCERCKLALYIQVTRGSGTAPLCIPGSLRHVHLFNSSV